jgi:hypothetical protein
LTVIVVATITIVILLAAFFLHLAETRAAATQAMENLIVRRITLVDQQGAVRGILQVRAEGPALTLYDSSSKGRVFLGIDGEGARLVLRDSMERARIELETIRGVDTEDEFTHLRLFAPPRSLRASRSSSDDGGFDLWVDRDGANLVLHNQRGNTLVQVAAFADDPYLNMARKGRSVFRRP